MRLVSKRQFLSCSVPALMAATAPLVPILAEPASPILSMWQRRPGIDRSALFNFDSVLLEEIMPTTLQELAIQARVAQMGDYDYVRSVRNLHFGPRQILALAELHGVTP
jgi:hypothetical protein